MVKQQPGEGIEKPFFEWLEKRVSAVRLPDLRLAAKELDKYCKNKKLLTDSFFTVYDAAVITRLRTRLQSDRFFALFNRGKVKHMVFILEYYGKYLSDLEKQKNRAADVCSPVDTETRTTTAETVSGNDECTAKKEAPTPQPIQQKQNTAAPEKIPTAEQPSAIQDTDADDCENSAACQGHAAQQLVMEEVLADPLILYAERNGIAWVDKRGQNGCLWLIGNMNLYTHIYELRRMGYHFVYAQEGGKATQGRPGWFLQKKGQHSAKVPPEPIAPPKEADSGKRLSMELQALLSGDEYEPLRACLIQQNILTVKQFEHANPWVFMNRYDLYSIGRRQTLYTQIMSRLKPAETNPPEQLYTLETKTTSFQGGSPAEAFAAFCESIAQKYPLKIRSLLDMPYNGKGSIVLSRTPLSGECLKMMNPTAYIDRTLTAQAVLYYGKWICQMCGEADSPVTMAEPKAIVKPEPPKEAPKAMVKPEPSKEVSKAIVIPEPANEKPKAIEAAAQPKPEEGKSTAPSPNETDTAVHSTLAEQEQIRPKEPEPPKQIEMTMHTAANNRLAQRAETIVLEADLDGMTMEELNSRLRTTMVATKQAVDECKPLVALSGKIIHEEAFVDWEDGAAQMERILEKLLDKNNGYVSAAQFFEYVHAEMQMFLNDNDMDDARSVYDMAKHLFDKVGYHNKRFTFKGNQHISRNAEMVTNVLDIIKKFAREQGGFFTEDELTEYLKRVGVNSGNLRGRMQIYEKPLFFFYEEHTYITGESMGICEAWFETAKKALSNLFADMGDHIVLRDIQPWWYTQLPTLPGGKAWTALLLQSVLKHYGKEMDGAHTICGLEGQAGDTLHAMLVSGDSEIHTFADVVTAFLVDEEIEQRRFEAEELRQALVQRGMIAGSELIGNMPKALAKDERFAWDADAEYVTVKV